MKKIVQNLLLINWNRLFMIEKVKELTCLTINLSKIMKFNLNCEIEIDPLEYSDFISEYYILNPSNPWWDDKRPYHHIEPAIFNINLEWFNKLNIHNEIRDFWKRWMEGNYHIPKGVKCPNKILDWLENWTFSNIEYLNKRALELEEEGIELHNKVITREKERINHIKEYYSTNNYIPPKNAKPVIYKGKEYKSKKQCCILEKISLNTLNKYLLINGSQ